MFNSIFYYLFGCSVIFYYGIGLNRLLTLKKTYSSFLFNIIKSLIITLVPVTLSYIIMHFVLIPFKMVELFPFVTILILMSGTNDWTAVYKSAKMHRHLQTMI